jgi:hypothetical protein
MAMNRILIQQTKTTSAMSRNTLSSGLILESSQGIMSYVAEYALYQKNFEFVLNSKYESVVGRRAVIASLAWIRTITWQMSKHLGEKIS